MILTKVKQLSTDVIPIEKEAKLMAAASIMAEKSIGALVVVEEGKPIGMITERDILRAFANVEIATGPVTVATYMSTPLITINGNEGLGNAAQLMLMKGIRRLVVINDEGEVTGFINMRKLIKSIHESFIALFEA
ncbi:MAG: CBS domain-containing protein [Candidatus Kariarchaeaceae archaeon]|jgi:CBS domain-containing protein